MILPNSRVKVYDSRLYGKPIEDAMKTATVVCRYGKRSVYNEDWIYPDLIDVIFDHDGRLSKGHFTEGATEL